MFQLHGLNFYQCAGASAGIFSFEYWECVYSPIRLFILRICLLVVPNMYATDTLIDSVWRLAVKTPIIMLDIAIGCLLFWTVAGSKVKKLGFASLWLFHPAVFYNSAIFGRFDTVAAIFIFASLLMLVEHRDEIVFLPRRFGSDH